MSGIPAWVRPGVKCECIRTMARPAGKPAPVVGQVYVVRDPHIDPYGAPCLALVGMEISIANVWKAADGAPGPFWPVDWFRPLVSDTDELGIETVLYRAKGRKSKAPARESERA